MKAVDTLRIALPPISDNSRKSTTLVCTISSDGKVRLFDLAAVPSEVQAEVTQLSPLTEYDTKGSRLTCMALADGDVETAAASGKRKRPTDEDRVKEDETDDEEDQDEEKDAHEPEDGDGDEDENESETEEEEEEEEEAEED